MVTAVLAKTGWTWEQYCEAPWLLVKEILSYIATGRGTTAALVICETGWSWEQYCDSPRWLTEEIAARIKGRKMAMSEQRL